MATLSRSAMLAREWISDHIARMSPMECQICGQIELRAIAAPFPNDELIEYECGHCKHYETGVNPDYDPTPEEQGEPPITADERYAAAITEHDKHR